MIEIRVEKNVLSVLNRELLTSNTLLTPRCHFTFDKTWEDLTRTATFRVGSQAVSVTVLPDADDCCPLPWEMLQQKYVGQRVMVSVYGVSAEGKTLATIWDSLGDVRHGAEMGGNTEPPTPDIYQQFVQQVEQFADAAKRAEQEAKKAQVKAPYIDAGTKTWWVWSQPVGAYVDTFVSASGVPGPQGDQGIPGPVGPVGPIGPVGPQGIQGIQGIQGEVGPQGERGEIGPVGPQGVPGPIGPQGEVGPVGPAGPQGEQGIQGIPGPKGETGSVGPAGPKGEQGIQGVPGPKGETGSTGPVGPEGPRGEKGQTGERGPVGPIGPEGPEGPQGKQGPVGPQGPKGDTGAGFRVQGYYDSKELLEAGVADPQVGDAYGVGTAQPYDIYIYDAVKGWVNNGPLQGAKGETGPAGPQGEPGAPGPAGPAGAAGPQGPAGKDGAKGETGPAGKDGAPGAKGDPGADGGYYTPAVSQAGELTWTGSKAGMPAVPGVNIRGPEGPAGKDGATGPQGPAGTPGEKGDTGPQGPAGATGPAGAAGERGPAGEKGATGAPGPAGADGPAGSPGKDATINGVNALTINTDEHLSAQQSGGILTIGLKSVPQTFKTQLITLTTAGWSKSGDRYQQQVNVSGVTASTPVVIVDCALTGTDLDADAAVLEAWQGPSANNVAQGAGTLTFYSYDQPKTNIPVNVGVA